MENKIDKEADSIETNVKIFLLSKKEDKTMSLLVNKNKK